MVGMSHSGGTLDPQLKPSECDSARRAAAPSRVVDLALAFSKIRVRGIPAFSGPLSALGTFPIGNFQKRKKAHLAYVLDLNQTYREYARDADRKRRCPAFGQHRRHRCERVHALRIHLRWFRVERSNPGSRYGECSGGDG